MSASWNKATQCLFLPHRRVERMVCSAVRRNAHALQSVLSIHADNEEFAFPVND